MRAALIQPASKIFKTNLSLDAFAGMPYS